jgi:hypothetical protein
MQPLALVEQVLLNEPDFDPFNGKLGTPSATYSARRLEIDGSLH